VVAIGFGQTVGAGVFALTPIAIGLCGNALPIAYMFSALPIIFVLLILSVLAGAIPTVGGTYKYPSRLFSPLWAFVGVWGYAFGLLLGAFPLYAVTCVHYFNELGFAVDIRWGAAALLTFFFLINVVGIEIAASFQAAMVAILVLALFLFSIDGLPEVNPVHFQDMMGGNLGKLLVASSLLTFAQVGSNSLIELGGEIKNPGKTIPRACFISLVLVTLLYLAISLVAVGVRSPEEWNVYIETTKAAGGAPTLIFAAKAFLGGPGLLFFVVCGSLLAIITTLNASYMWATKSLLVIAKDRLVPPGLAKVSPKFGTPVLFLTLVWALSTAAVLLELPLEVFGDYAAIGGMIIFVPVMISGYMLPKKMPQAWAESQFRVPLPLLTFAMVVGVILSFISMALILGDLAMKGKLIYVLFFLGWLVLGTIVFYIRRKKVPGGFDYDNAALRREFFCEDLAHERLRELKVVNGEPTADISPEQLIDDE
jgi:basic amino acid/polyamine antiporter, APA family